MSALLTPVVAILGSFVAYRQWVLAQNKLKLDLFDRRYRVYESARTLLASIATSGKVKEDEMFKYISSVREARWLLNVAVAEYLQRELYHKAIDHRTHEAELEGLPVGEERSKLVRLKAEVRKWLMAQYDVLDEKFAPYLQLRH